MNMRELRQALKNESEDVTKFRYFVALDTALSIVDSFERDLKNKIEKLEKIIEKGRKIKRGTMEHRIYWDTYIFSDIGIEIATLRRVLGQDSSGAIGLRPHAESNSAAAVPEKKEVCDKHHRQLDNRGKCLECEALPKEVKNHD